MTDITLINKIKELKKQKNAVILAHYYQNDDLQDIADFIGDSLDLSKKAKSSNAEIIVFCGVKFMGEVAKILNSKTKVIIPDMKAGCSLEESCPPKEFEKFCQENKDHTVISYINCSAEIKALSDIVVTSSNAENILNSLDKDEKIIFAPDKHLGKYLERKTGRKMKLWNGSCIVHERFSHKNLIELKERHKEAKIIAHPECPEELLDEAGFIGSTTKLLNYVQDNNGKDFIVLTEPNIIYQMKKNSPKSNFYAVAGLNKEIAECSYCNNCPYMALNTMEKLYNVLLNETNQITLNDNVQQKAKKSLDRMLQLS